jgi:hypothetical protein
VRAAINLAGVLIWLPLQALVITRLLRGEWRRFPLIFAFVIAEFLVFTAEVPTVWARVLYGTPETINWRVLFYQRGEVFKEFFTFIVVLSLINRATAQLQSRKLMRAACVVGAILFVGISFLIHHNPNTNVGTWMTPWTRDLNVGATVLDLALWFLLLARRDQDSRLLLLSGALGIQFTGAAIGDCLRYLATPHHISWLSMTGGIIVMASGLVRVYIWARAFRKAPEPRHGFILDVPAEHGS